MASDIMILICSLVLFGWASAEEEIKRDSSGTKNLLIKLKLFYTAERNWGPQSLPNEWKHAGAGCCLMPLAGCLVGREAIKKEVRPVSLWEVKQPKLSIGVGYSSGISYTGSKLAHPSRFAPFPSIGELPEAIFAHLWDCLGVTYEKIAILG